MIKKTSYSMVIVLYKLTSVPVDPNSAGHISSEYLLKVKFK